MPDDSERKALYIWKKEKSFGVVFSSLGIEDNSEEENIGSKELISKTVKDMIKTKLDQLEPEIKKTDPVIDAQLEPKVQKAIPFSEKQDLAKKETTIDLKEGNTDIHKYMKIAILYNFFSESYSERLWSNKTSLDVSSIDITKNDIVEYLKKIGDFTQELQIGLPSEKECLIAMNVNKIKTNHIYDMINGTRNSDYFFRDLEKMGVSKEKLLANISVTQTNNVHIDEIIDICMNAKHILRERGLELDVYDDTPYGRRQSRDVRPNRTLSAIIDDHDFSDEDIEDIFNGVLASVNPIDIENVNPFKYSKSSKGSKEVKERVYEFNNPAIDILKGIVGIIYNIKDKERYYELEDRLPYYMKGMFTENMEFFEVTFMSNWTMSGGSNAQTLGHEVFYDFGVNAELNDFYNKESEYDESFREECKYRKERLNSHLASLYEKSQNYYRDKYKKSYDTKTIKLYRGVGENIVDSYIPGSLESWTANISTAKKFASMMSRSHDDYTVLMAEVPIQDIFGSWDSFTETWPGEEDLKGKKEYIVMGGTFATTPIYKYDIVKKDVINKLAPFKEWLEMKEAKAPKKDSIKIITPSMSGFKKALESGKSALGNDPRENEIRKSDKENG